MRPRCIAIILLAACSSPATPEPAAATGEARQATPRPEPAPEPTSQPAQDTTQGVRRDGQDDGYEATSPSTGADGSEVYGGAIDPAVPEVPLATLLSEPARFRDETIKTGGTIERVCKNMGCWLELSGDDASHQIRAPMAGHSYFLPQKVVGKQATVQGKVTLRELTAAQKAHYEAEGARATDVAVSIDATAVAVR